MTDLTGQLRAALWWLVPLVVLALVIGWETGWGKAFVHHPAPPETIAPKPVAAAVLPDYAIAGGPSAHTEMVQRTLFNPTRRPAPAAPEVAASRMQRGQFALTGTLVIDGKSTAYLREVQGNKSRRVFAGDKVNGMMVAEVRPDRVRLTMGDESEELTLKVGTNPRPTVQPAAPVVAAVPNATPAPNVVVPPPVAAVPGQTEQPTQTLAERRRAARAAALDQQQAGGQAGGQVSGQANPNVAPAQANPQYPTRQAPRANTR